MHAVDTNLLVRLLVRDDADRVRAAEAFVAGAWVSHLVLAETQWVLDAIYDRSPTQIANAIDRLLNHKELTLQDADVVALALADVAGKTGTTRRLGNGVNGDKLTPHGYNSHVDTHTDSADDISN